MKVTLSCLLVSAPIAAAFSSLASSRSMSAIRAVKAVPALVTRASVRMMAAGSPKKKIVVFGGDGFCGWPTALHLSDQGHEVIIVDNLSRRAIDLELGCDSLTPIQPMEVGSTQWKQPTAFRFLLTSSFTLC
jgi:UDP-sulfoquinovose synthase